MTHQYFREKVSSNCFPPQADHETNGSETTGKEKRGREGKFLNKHFWRNPAGTPK